MLQNKEKMDQTHESTMKKLTLKCQCLLFSNLHFLLLPRQELISFVQLIIPKYVDLLKTERCPLFVSLLEKQKTKQKSVLVSTVTLCRVKKQGKHEFLLVGGANIQWKVVLPLSWRGYQWHSVTSKRDLFRTQRLVVSEKVAGQ